MPLPDGTRIGGYEVVALVGAGGMGEVYRALDTRLGREVAIKVLAPRIAADADGLMRFEREARLLAALNHPNIAAIYGVEDAVPGQPALVLELVDGDTLADRIARGPIPVAEALGYARQIAEALDTAHEAGIVHRDLKPGNIKITPAGAIKVLDFGLAKAIAAASHDPAVDPSQSPTITIEGTQRGVILGTAAYMSPEQARGKTIDKRTDIWAFGCVLYEMLTGRMTFSGETTSDIIAAIIERTPDWSKLPASTPAHVRRVVERCLEKDPKRRARDIADVAAELTAGTAAVADSASSWRPLAIALVVTLVLVAAGTAAVLRWMASAPEPPAPIEFTFGAPPNHTLSGFPATVSPDGRLVAFVARDPKQIASLWLRPIDSVVVRRLAGTEGAASPAFWSPDGGALAFFDGTALKRIAVEGGPAVTIASGMVSNLGASWAPDNSIVLAPANRTALVRVPAAGGALQPVTALDPNRENSHRWPHVLPDGRHFLFTVRSDSLDNRGIKLGSFDSTAARRLVNAPSPGRYAPPGWLLFMTPDEVLMAQRLDSTSGILSGDPQPIAAPVRYNGPSFEGTFDVSRDGRVLTYAAATRTASKLLWTDRTGKVLGTVGPEARYLGIQLGASDRTVGAELADEHYGTRDVWLIDVATASLTRLTTNAATDWMPVLSPDAATVAFASDRGGLSTIYLIAANAAGGEKVLYRHAKGGAFPMDWSRDGKFVLAQVDDGVGRPSGVVAVPLDGSAPIPLIESDPATVNSPRFSPEGDRIAFVSTATGAREVYVMSIADRRRVRISTEGGGNPAWGRDGRELFYQSPRGELMRAQIDRGPTVISSPPAALFRPCESVNMFFAPPGASDWPYDVTSDGMRFLVKCTPADALPSAVTVVVNWQSKLR